MKAVIINKKSKFVVLTNPRQKKSSLETQPLTVSNQNTDRWKKNIKKAGCNYIDARYPQSKPYLILEALKASYPRAVLYIDEAVEIKKYPHIFDILGVDFMAFGMNIDPRYLDGQCFYPYVFETRGGILYFNNTSRVKQLLKEWSFAIEENPSLSKDKLFSLLFNQQELFLTLAVIQLPLEYLWDNFEEDGEEPPLYNQLVTNRIQPCIRRILFFEFIFFPKQKFVKGMKRYLQHMREIGRLVIIPYSQKYGPYNKRQRINLSRMRWIKVKRVTGLVYVAYNRNLSLLNSHLVKDKREIIPTILKYLRYGNDVIYVPAGAEDQSIVMVGDFASEQNLEFICRNDSNSNNKYKQSYNLIVNKDYPMYFNSGSAILKHLLILSLDFSNIDYFFTYFFLSRIRCKWV